MASASGSSTIERAPSVTPPAPVRCLRREPTWGPRCPQCAGPLVFGEGCSVCPICGHSSCTV